MDELRISNVARSAAWIATEYNNQNSPSTFYSVAAEETAPWYNGAWGYRKKLRIDQTKVGSGGVSNFPVLINRTDTDLQSKAQADGDDILFTSSDGTTKLSHEIEKYVSATGELVAWVKVPSVSAAAATDIYMYYGNASATNQQDAANVWDTNYKGVWHLKEDPSGTAPQMKDSTANANHGTSQGAMTSGDQVAGKIGGSLDLDGVNDTVGLGTDTDFHFNGTLPFTVTAWVKPATGAAGKYIVSRYNSGVLGNWYFVFSSTLKLRAYREISPYTALTGSTSLPYDQWSHAVMRYDGTNLAVFLNGVSDATPLASGNITDNQSNVNTFIGSSETSNSPSDFYVGGIDNVRISNIARSDGWVTTEYNNLNSPSTFLSSVGAEEKGFTKLQLLVPGETAAPGTASGKTGTP
ncbi:MAG: DUF2341 domain-containing protein, partial [Planctomycetota bacterium]